MKSQVLRKGRLGQSALQLQLYTRILTATMFPLQKDNLSVKLSRRISTRVGDLFKPKPKPKPAPAIVDEFPPKIDEPVPVAPLEN